jgi:hypothetical protein
MANEGGWKQKLRKALYIFLGIVVLVLVASVFILNYTYSEGNRAGVLMKFSKKGYIFKTYEGDLNIGGVGNVSGTAQMNQVWQFSVKDQPVADSLMTMEGKKVSLHYRQILKNLWWQGETDYFVDGVKVIGQ